MYVWKGKRVKIISRYFTFLCYIMLLEIVNMQFLFALLKFFTAFCNSDYYWLPYGVLPISNIVTLTWFTLSALLLFAFCQSAFRLTAFCLLHFAYETDDG